MPQVRYSITGISAMWLSSTAVPSMARMGGTTLSLIPPTRQAETTWASVPSSSSGTASTTRSTRASASSHWRSSWESSLRRSTSAT